VPLFFEPGGRCDNLVFPYVWFSEVDLLLLCCFCYALCFCLHVLRLAPVCCPFLWFSFFRFACHVFFLCLMCVLLFFFLSFLSEEHQVTTDLLGRFCLCLLLIRVVSNRQGTPATDLCGPFFALCFARCEFYGCSCHWCLPFWVLFVWSFRFV